MSIFEPNAVYLLPDTNLIDHVFHCTSLGGHPLVSQFTVSLTAILSIRMPRQVCIPSQHHDSFVFANILASLVLKKFRPSKYLPLSLLQFYSHHIPDGCQELQYVMTRRNRLLLIISFLGGLGYSNVSTSTFCVNVRDVEITLLSGR